MKLIPRNWRFRNLVSLVHLLVGIGCGLTLRAITPYPSILGWTLVLVVTVVLFLLCNYRVVSDSSDREHEKKASR